jgi:hypothetical protein
MVSSTLISRVVVNRVRVIIQSRVYVCACVYVCARMDVCTCVYTDLDPLIKLLLSQVPLRKNVVLLTT